MTDISTPQSLSADQYAIGLDETGTLIGSVIDESQINYAVLGKPTTSTTQNDVGTGIKTFTLDVDNGITVDDPVRIKSLDDPACWMYGICVSRDTGSYPIEIEVLVYRCSDLTITGQNWQIQKTPNFASLSSSVLGYATDTLQFGSDIVVGQVVSFTTDANKRFRPGTHFIVSALNVTDGTVQDFDGTGWAYNKTTGDISISVENLSLDASTGEYSAWLVYAQDGPTLFTSNQRYGLDVSVSGTTLTVTAGSMLDSTGDVILSTNGLSKDLTALFLAGDGNGCQSLSSDLSGTITIAGTAGTGSGTDFTSQFSASSFSPNTVFPDFTSRRGNLTQGVTTITVAGSGTSFVASVSDDTTLGVTGLTGVTNATYKRGGWVDLVGIVYGALLVQNDTTGDIDIATISLSPNGAPDLPSGYSVYGALATISKLGSVWSAIQWPNASTFDALSPNTTEGDMTYFHNGSNVRLSVGANATILSSNGTGPVYRTSGNLGLVSTAIIPNTAPAAGEILIGNAGGTAYAKNALSGDVTITSAGVTAIKSSVALAGSPTTTTQGAGDNSTKIGTTAYADAGDAATLTTAEAYTDAQIAAHTAAGWSVVGTANTAFPTGANSLSVTGITKDDILIYFTGVKCATTTRFLLVQPNGDTTVADYLGTGGTIVASLFNPLGTTQSNSQTTTGCIEISGAQQAIGKLCSSAGKLAASTMVSNDILWDVATVISSLTFIWNSTGNFSGGTYTILQR